MTGIKALRKIQIGRETVPGTAVPATLIYRGLGGMPDDQRTVVFPEENIGYLSGTDRQYQPKLMGKAAFDDTPATFEQLPHILEAGIGAVTPTDDTGSGFIYAYNLSTTSGGMPKTYTIEAGDNVAVEVMPYSFVVDFSLSGTAGEAWNMGATWNGRTWTPGAFTAALTPPAVEEILFSKTTLYIDNSTDAIGTSLKSNTLLAATLNVNTGFVPVFTADGQLYFSFVKQVAPEVTLQITFEHNAAAVAEKAAWRAGTPRQLRLLTTGSALTTPGAHATKKLIIDLAGKWESFDVLGDQDGNDIVTATFRARYNADANLFAKIVVVNELASL